MFTLCVPLTFCIPAASAAPVMRIDYPANADAEQPVHIFVNTTSELPMDEVLLTYVNPANDLLYNEYMNQTYSNGTNGTWHFEIPAQRYKGSLEVWIIASDISGASTRYPTTGGFTILLDGPEPVRSFPWNIVIIVIFLGITLVATELIFKPGFYRPTGRQRAKALEEEDRKKELEEKNEE